MFYVLVFALAVPLWVLDVFADAPAGVPLRLPISALMFPAPMLAAVLLTYRRRGSVRDLLARTVDPRRVRPRIWYVPVVTVMPGVAALTYAVLRFGGLPTSGERTPAAALPVLLVVFLIAAVGEEVGWTGFALEPLRDRYGDLGAGLILGAVWAVWHLVPLVQAHRAAGWIAVWFAGTVAVRVIMVRLYAGAGGAAVTAVIIHALQNLSDTQIPGLVTHPAPLVVQTALFVLLAAALAFAPVRSRRSAPG